MNQSQQNFKSMSAIAKTIVLPENRSKGDFSTMKQTIPTMMTIREVAKTGLMCEYTLRALVKQGKVPYVKAGVKVLINFELFYEQLNNPQQLCS